MPKAKQKPQTPVRSNRMVSGRGYAWLCDFGMCHWADPDIVSLRHGGKPSPEAKQVAVRIILEKDYRKLIALTNS